MQIIKVLIADDDMRFWRFVKELFSSEEDLQIIGEAKDGQEAILKAKHFKREKMMKVFRNWAVFFVMFLFFVAALSCGKEEEGRKVDLDKKTSDVSRLVKTTDMKKSLTFCFDRRLDPYEEIKIYGSFLDYLEKETGLYFTLLFSESYQETIENIGAGKAQFAFIGGLSFLKAEHDYGVRMLVKGLDQNGSGIAVNKDGLINWDKTEMSGGFSDVEPQDYDVLT